MFRNQFTLYLEEKGWRQTAPMVFTREDMEYHISFDNSNAIEIYNTLGRVKSSYLTSMADIKAVLQELT